MRVQQLVQCKVSVLNQGMLQDFHLRKGLGFQALIAKHPDIPIEFDCRAADCGICLVSVVEGGENLSPPTPGERDFLKAMNAAPSERLTCQCRIIGPVKVEVLPP